MSSVLVSALDKLPLEQRIIVELKNIEGRSHKEIADFLDISVTAAKVRLHRAHQKLRLILEEVDRWKIFYIILEKIFCVKEQEIECFLLI